MEESLALCSLTLCYSFQKQREVEESHPPLLQVEGSLRYALSNSYCVV